MPPIAALVFCLILTLAAFSDLCTYRIPNVLPALLAATALVMLASHGGRPAWLAAGASLLFIAAVTLFAYAWAALGGGDVKLLLAIALWIPIDRLAQFLLALALIGGAQALATLTIRRLTAPNLAPSSKTHMPYALSIALAGLTSALMGGLR
jgi:prepilin peptidase CpaA